MYITVEHWLTIEDSKSHRDMLNPVLILMPVLAVLSTYVSSGFEIMCLINSDKTIEAPVRKANAPLI